MKILITLSLLFASAIAIFTSCKKEKSDQVDVNPAVSRNEVSRKVQFELYTDKDFSDDNAMITFKLSIQKLPNQFPDQILWDSVFSPMRIKDIPGQAQKIIVEKLVPNNDPSLLKVGFYYSIENIGRSWHLDSFATGEVFKTVDFNFQ